MEKILHLLKRRFVSFLDPLFLSGIFPRFLGYLGGCPARDGDKNSGGKVLQHQELDRILILKLGRIGDSVFAIPFIRELKQNFPNAALDLIVHPSIVNLFERCPYVRDVLAFDGRGRGYLNILRKHFKSSHFGMTTLRKKQYDAAFIPRVSADIHHASYLAFYSRAKHRVGFSEDFNETRQKFNKGYNSLLTYTVNKSPDRVVHQVEALLNILRNMDLEVTDDSLEAWLSDQDHKKIKDLINALPRNHEDETLIGIAPGAGHPKRIWPKRNYARLNEWLTSAIDAKVFLIGDKQDRSRCSYIAKVAPKKSRNMAGELTLRETVSLLKRCDLFLGNDSGPMHLASLADTPVVCVSCHPKTAPDDSGNAPKRIHPWKTEYKMVQPVGNSGCENGCNSSQAHCITNVSVQIVKQATEDLLHGTALR